MTRKNEFSRCARLAGIARLFGLFQMRRRSSQELKALQAHPEFNHYLAFIMANASNGEAPEMRQRAALLLKNNCSEHWDDMTGGVRDYIKSAALASAARAIGSSRPYGMRAAMGA